MPQLRHAATKCHRQRKQAESGIQFGADYDALVPTYVSYLRGEQFLP